jgi:nucleotide-binding universal stress UspA family protein
MAPRRRPPLYPPRAHLAPHSALRFHCCVLFGVPRPVLDPHVDDVREASAYLDRAARQAEVANVRVSTHVRSGDVPEAILAEIDERGVGLVVMATRAHSGLVRAVLGSVASEVVSRSPVPVVLLREDGRRVTGMKTLLIPVDRSPGSLLALGAARELARATGAHLRLLEVVTPIPLWTYDAGAGFYFPHDIDPGWDAAALASAQRYVDDLTNRLQEQGVSTVGLAKMSDVSGNVPQAIVETAEDVSADLIVMSTRAHTGPARAVLGSVADAVARSAQPPVLLLRYDSASAPASPGQDPEAASPENPGILSHEPKRRRPVAAIYRAALIYLRGTGLLRRGPMPTRLVTPWSSRAQLMGASSSSAARRST